MQSLAWQLWPNVFMYNTVRHSSVTHKSSHSHRREHLHQESLWSCNLGHFQHLKEWGLEQTALNWKLSLLIVGGLAKGLQWFLQMKIIPWIKMHISELLILHICFTVLSYILKYITNVPNSLKETGQSKRNQMVKHYLKIEAQYLKGA